ncbi:Low molecular weight protein-tyrosine-phosphatase wzb [Sodalis glossinidius str. 'morsitans']|uniref:protein-tyrosine-phosphatase n=2 Tax=Sodalis glossinidius (strain morsitans) TaxID=343509 RepID=A0A193QIT9_SODGM|nr:Low molecular weight protein-tyrosine-phosphatase wzb [Sodalis glossinidius str. 'morsitans']
MAMFNKILVVCVGNICRSPTGEWLLKKYIPDKTIESAGINALIGNDADAKALEVAKKNQLDIVGHQARQLNRRLCKDYDLILVMEKGHIDAVCQIAPGARGKVMLYGHWIAKEIPDPYCKSLEAFEATYLLLKQAAREWASKLS